MKKILILLGIAIVIVGSLIGFYQINLMPVDKKNSEELIEINIPSGTSGQRVAEILKENNLIRSEFIFKIYQKIHNTTIQAGTYRMNKTYSVKDISDILANGKVYTDDIWLTLVEGKNVRNIAKIYSDSLGFNEDDVISTIADVDYLDELIDKYWFLNDDILDKNIYYPLEGYLFPDTYKIPKSYTIKDVINTQLNNLSSKLDPLRSKIEASEFSVHELLTLASMVELEANTTEERKMVAGVFINRINRKMNLGSDVTTYYAEKVDIGTVSDLYASQYNSYNAYNTRSSQLIGLPVGPICNTGIDSINAVLDYTKNDYLYFYADKNGNILYSETLSGHQDNINK